MTGDVLVVPGLPSWVAGLLMEVKKVVDNLKKERYTEGKEFGNSVAQYATKSPGIADAPAVMYCDF